MLEPTNPNNTANRQASELPANTSGAGAAFDDVLAGLSLGGHRR